MSKQINDGGPAFARDSHMDKQLGLYVHQQGMSLRDYFAAAALQGLLSIMAKDYDAFFANKLAHACYETADAMLKAKEAKP